MPRFSDEFLTELRMRTDIEQLISAYVPLKRRGKNLVGLCPFHNEKTPSFTVYPETQSYYCFGCGAGGEAVNFICDVEHLDFTGAHPDAVKLLLDTPDTPIILVSSHHGVWEAATNVLSFARPMIAIARVMNNKLAAKWMAKYHFRGPVTVIDKKKGFKPEIMRQWKDTNAAMTILMDQHTSGGAMLKFFGRPAKTFTSATRLAMRTGYPIVVGSFVRIAPFKYRLVGDKPLVFSKSSDMNASTQLLNDRLESAIRQYPEQYLWAHRRWRND